MIRFIEPETAKDINQFYHLCIEYIDSLGFELDFQGVDSELANLPGVYAPPEGAIILAMHNDRLIGGVALKKLEEDICEMKRLYVKPEYRGQGIGLKLSELILEKAKKIGYKKMRLDTILWMKEAISIYKFLGFREIESYYHNPVNGAMYFEIDLQQFEG